MSTQAGKRLGLLVCKPEAVQRLSEPLEQCGWEISQAVVLADDQFINDPGADVFNQANAIVVDLDGANNNQLEHLNELVSVEVRPVLFNDSSHDQHWSQRLNDKLTEVLDALDANTKFTQATPAIDYVPSDQNHDDGPSDLVASVDVNMSGNVWLLSASLGGPEALREFFSALASRLPVSFIVMQRIAKEHIDVLANHLKQYTDYSISVMNGSTELSDSAVVLIADGNSFSVDNKNRLLPEKMFSCEEINDHIMTVLAERYGTKANTIVFSAIGEDGVEGCRKILAEGGRVWLQAGMSGYFARLAQEYDAQQRFEVATSAKLAQKLSSLYQ